MKLKINLNAVVFALVLGLNLFACSSNEQQAEEPVSGDGATAEEAAASDETATDETSAEVTDSADAETADASSASAEEEMMNAADEGADVAATEESAIPEESATEEITADTEPAMLAQERKDGATDLSSMDMTGKTESQEMGIPEATPTAVPMPATSKIQESNIAAPVAATETIESATGRVVRYVLVDSLEAHQTASNSSPVTKTFEKGTVLVVTYEGNWARLDDGSFVNGSSSMITSKVVGKKRKKMEWASQR